MAHILKCEKCDNYQLSEKCDCGGKCVRVKPAKFSPDDKFGKYRRLAKKNVDDKDS